MSLRKKLIIFSITLALIPLGVAGWSMLRITRDELKQSAASELRWSAESIARLIDDFYAATWLSPLELIASTIGNPALGGTEKVSMLREGVSQIFGIVALQISVEGIEEPLMVTKSGFHESLRAANVDADSILKLPTSRIAELAESASPHSTAIDYIPNANVWLMTILLRLDERAFGRPAYLAARIDLESLNRRITSSIFAAGSRVIILDAEGRNIFGSRGFEPSSHQLKDKITGLLATDNRLTLAEPYRKASGETILCAYGFPQNVDWAALVEKGEDAAYGIVFDAGEIGLNAGDVLLLYTDGMVEAVDSEEVEFGEERLVELFGKNSERASREICEHLAGELVEYQGDLPQFDDMTSVVMKVFN